MTVKSEGIYIGALFWGKLMKKIIIVGPPGAGKSTLARLIQDVTQIKVIHLDTLFWKPGWVETPREDWIDIQQSLIQGEKWIIDGNYQSTIDIRFSAADTIIFLDMPRLLCIGRVIKRHLLYTGRVRPDRAKGCSEKLTWEYLKEVWNFPNLEGKILVEKLYSLTGKKQIIRLTSKADIANFLDKLRTLYER